MDFKFVSTRKSFATLDTRIGFHSGVQAHVAVSVGLLLEAFTAHLALVASRHRCFTSAFHDGFSRL